MSYPTLIDHTVMMNAKNRNHGRNGSMGRSAVNTVTPIAAQIAANIRCFMLTVLIPAKNWFFTKSAFRIPAGTNSFRNCFSTYSCASGPFLDGECIAIKRKSHIVVPVVLLLLHCRPTTVSRLVIAARINAIKRIAYWAFAHIREKVFELKPSLANGCAARPVFLVTKAVFVKTPAEHIDPRLICLGSCLSVRGVALNTYVALLVAVQTTARFCVALSQRLGAYLDNIPAIASAFKNCTTKFVCSGTSFYQEATETLSGKVDIGWHE